MRAATGLHRNRIPRLIAHSKIRHNGPAAFRENPARSCSPGRGRRRWQSLRCSARLEWLPLARKNRFLWTLTHAVQIDESARRRHGAPDNLVGQTLEHTQLRGHCNALSSPDQVSDPAQQLTVVHWPIRGGHGIALSNAVWILAILCHGDNPMGTQPAAPSDQNDVSNLNLIQADALDPQPRLRPNGRKHAPTPRGQTNAAE